MNTLDIPLLRLNMTRTFIKPNAVPGEQLIYELSDVTAIECPNKHGNTGQNDEKWRVLLARYKNSKLVILPEEPRKVLENIDRQEICDESVLRRVCSWLENEEDKKLSAYNEQIDQAMEEHAFKDVLKEELFFSNFSPDSKAIHEKRNKLRYNHYLLYTTTRVGGSLTSDALQSIHEKINQGNNAIIGNPALHWES